GEWRHNDVQGNDKSRLREAGDKGGCATCPLRERKWRRGRAATQTIAGSGVNVTDPCATFFAKVAQGYVAWGRAPDFGNTNAELARCYLDLNHALATLTDSKLTPPWRCVVPY